MAKCPAGGAGGDRPEFWRDHRHGLVRQSEVQRRSVQPCRVAAPQPGLVDEDLHVHRGDPERTLHDDHADHGLTASDHRPRFADCLFAAELRRLVPRHLPAPGLHGQLTQYPRGQGRARRRGARRRGHSADDGCAALAAAAKRLLCEQHRREQLRAVSHPRRPVHPSLPRRVSSTSRSRLPASIKARGRVRRRSTSTPTAPRTCSTPRSPTS